MPLSRTSIAFSLLLALCACSASPPKGQILSEAQVTHAQPWPTARSAAPDAPPQILAVQLNETTIAGGDRWRGRIATSTNVASVEVRTESFSFTAHRTAFGQYAFEVHVLDMLPQYRRGYTLQIIARNTAGRRAERFIPIRFR
ncbi:MAG: hypothetical protein KGM44_14005 [bacterium]|nr:hypothetical protein [bacterium]